MKKLIIAFTTVALAVASAATKYSITLYQPSVVNGTQLKPGDYKIEVNGDKAVFKQGKNTVETPVKVEDDASKASSNSIRYADGNKIQEIRIGGSHTKLVFGGASNETPTNAR
jgi:hypothetical protein